MNNQSINSDISIRDILNMKKKDWDILLEDAPEYYWFLKSIEHEYRLSKSQSHYCPKVRDYKKDHLIDYKVMVIRDKDDNPIKNEDGKVKKLILGGHIESKSEYDKFYQSKMAPYQYQSLDTKISELI